MYNEPEIMGPGASEVQAVADATGSPHELPSQDSLPGLDLSFPFGRPENINWEEIDQAGIILIKELNLRPWIKTTEYCSGHPLDRPAGELSLLYPISTGENVYEEIHTLDLAYVRGLISDIYFRRRKQELRDIGATRFFLNVNVYNQTIFQDWIRALTTMVMVATNSGINLLNVRYNQLRLGMNYSIYWDYWTMEERDLIHALTLECLSHFPV